MRSLIVTASMASVLASATGAGAAPGISGGAPKFGSQEARPAAVAADVPASEVGSTIERTPAPAGGNGLMKSKSLAPPATRVTRAAAKTSQKRASITRVAPVRTARGLSAAKPSTQLTADVPLSVIKTTIVPTRAPAGAKKLARSASSSPGLGLHSSTDKFSAKADSKVLPD